MIAFFREHLGTIAVTFVLLDIVVAIIARLVRYKKAGKCAGCGGCGGACDAGGHTVDDNITGDSRDSRSNRRETKAENLLT